MSLDNLKTSKMIMAKIALGTWAWGAGAFGGDTVFGSKTDVDNLKPVFDKISLAWLLTKVESPIVGAQSCTTSREL